MKNQIVILISDILKEMGIPDMVPEVEVPEDAGHGDYTTNIAMILAKSLKKAPASPQGGPMEIALEVKERLRTYDVGRTSEIRDQNTVKRGHPVSPKLSLSPILSAIDRVEVAPPGFINIFLSEAKLGSIIQEVLKQKEGFGTSQRARSERSRRVTVEFTDPNPFKEFHIGHLYSNSVGEAISRLLESQGNTVRRVNYQGDVGMHVAKALYALLRSPLSPSREAGSGSTRQSPLSSRIEFLGKAYAAGSKAFEESEQAKKDIGEINKKIYEKSPDVYALYRQTRQWSLDYFETIYARLGTVFSGYYFESEVGPRGVRIVREHIKDGVFEESEGAIVYRGEKKGLHTRVFINRLGLPTYEAKELGLAPTKYDDWAYDRSLIVTGNEINEYFKVLLAALSEVNPTLAGKTRHIGHGMVRKSDGTKMSSRSGDVLTGEGLLDEVKGSIYILLDKNKSNYTKVERDDIAEKAAVAAVKYSLLRVSLPSDVAFDLKTSVSFDGDSGPYLQYTYARCKSVLRKSGNDVIASASEAISQDKEIATVAADGSLAMTMNPEERSVLRLLTHFPDVVSDAAEHLSPSTLCTYLFKFASAFNLFYAKHTILETQDLGLRTHSFPTSYVLRPTSASLRLSLTAATAQVLKNGLYLLGIETLEQM